MTDGAEIARLDHVSHRYGRTVALDDVSLGLPAGRMVGVIGPDGVGKSTRRVEIAAQSLGHVGDARALRRAVASLRHVAAERQNLAGLDPAHPRDEGEQGRFANAVRPDHPHHAPRRQAERHVVERRARHRVRAHQGQRRVAARPRREAAVRPA
jgi:RecA/RadA recombinase